MGISEPMFKCLTARLACHKTRTGWQDVTATVSIAQRRLALRRPRTTGSKAEDRQGVLPSVVQMVQTSGQGLPARWVGHISPACFLILMAAQVSACSRATLTASKPEHRLTLQVNKIKEPILSCYLSSGLQANTNCLLQARSKRPLCPKVLY
jgi:hypothetical protein